MIFTETPLAGAFLIDLEPKSDERGFFARSFCVDEFARHGLETKFVQMNTSHNIQRGTLRGLHYQLSPHEEVKVVRCLRGSIEDVILDLRTDSPTFGKSFGAVLSEQNRRMMYVPRGFAHGFITLADDTEITYLVSSFYNSAHERGIRWDDPAFEVKWAIHPETISVRDQSHPDFEERYHLGLGLAG